MNPENALNEMFGNFDITERDKKLYELAKRYHMECEAYDRTVCTGPMRHGSIMPYTPREIGLVIRNALSVRKKIGTEAMQDGFTVEELARAIGKWHE